MDSYEKKYKEALEKARQLCAYPTSKPFISDLQDLFPELTESNDERIRKELIDAILGLWDNDALPMPLSVKRKDEWIAWLEKQGEQKPKDRYTFKSIPRLLEMIKPTDKAKAYCQKLINTLAKEGYNIDAKIVEEVLKGWNGEDVPMAVMEDQKSAWSEEDMKEALRTEYEKGRADAIAEMQKEWSEEDEVMLQACLDKSTHL